MLLLLLFCLFLKPFVGRRESCGVRCACYWGDEAIVLRDLTAVSLRDNSFLVFRPCEVSPLADSLPFPPPSLYLAHYLHRLLLNCTKSDLPMKF
jgi:hypothetical protein